MAGKKNQTNKQTKKLGVTVFLVFSLLIIPESSISSVNTNKPYQSLSEYY